MARNRKREGTLLRLLPLTQGLVICAILASVGVGYVWQKNLILRLGHDIKQAEQHLEMLRKRNDVLVDQVARLKSPAVLEAKCRIWNLGLGLPKESQIVRVPDPFAPQPLDAVGRERSEPPAAKPWHGTLQAARQFRRTEVRAN